MPEDMELERLKRRKMLKFMNELFRKKFEKEREIQDPKKVLGKILTDRAWDVLRAAESQYPKATRQVVDELARLVLEGKLSRPISGGQLMLLFRSLGMNVRLQTRICVLENGKLKTLEEKLREK